MRFKGFMRWVFGQDQPEFVEFKPDHFREAGVPVSTYSGMPVLEAHELVNKWNSKGHQRFVYWLTA